LREILIFQRASASSIWRLHSGILEASEARADVMNLMSRSDASNCPDPFTTAAEKTETN
jgi:hypothetical protein